MKDEVKPVLGLTVPLRPSSEEGEIFLLRRLDSSTMHRSLFTGTGLTRRSAPPQKLPPPPACCCFVSVATLAQLAAFGCAEAAARGSWVAAAASCSAISDWSCGDIEYICAPRSEALDKGTIVRELISCPSSSNEHGSIPIAFVGRPSESLNWKPHKWNFHLEMNRKPKTDM